MKKMISIALVLAMALSLVACGGASSTPASDPASQVQGNVVPQIDAKETKTADIVIVGAGGAGLAAAVEAVDNGAESVIILEKTAVTGGSLNYTGGTMAGAETVIQELDGIEDTKESFVQDILKNGAQAGNEELIRAFVDEDVDAIQWLWDNGLSDNEFAVDRATQTRSVFAPEHALYSVKRSYKPRPDNAEKYKAAVHEILDTVVAGNDKITIEFQTTATQLVNNEQGQVLSVAAVNADGDTILYTANKAVIMATGGYSGNLKMMGAFTENGADYLPGGSSAADGYGIYMMQNVGAYIDEEVMGYIPTFPMGLDTGNGPGKIASTYMWKVGGICVNQEGNRFVDETEDAVDVREVALEQQPGAIQYDIFTDDIIADAEELNASVFWNFFYAPGMPFNSFVVSADSLEELAEKLDMPAEALTQTVEKYNECVETQTTDEFGRQFTEDSLNPAYNVAVNKIEGEHFYAVPLHALCVMTLGGVQINTDAQVLDANGAAIPGLYAAGECTGGIWGKFVSGGTGVMGPVAFGRIAARHAMNNEPAADYVMQPAQTVITEDLFQKEDAQTEARFDMSQALNDGEYTATVEGQEGPMTVKVVVAEGKISSVVVEENHETPAVAAAALESVPAKIVEQNSCDVDGVSGATLTSGRIMDAVAECLTQAAA